MSRSSKGEGSPLKKRRTEQRAGVSQERLQQAQAVFSGLLQEIKDEVSKAKNERSILAKRVGYLEDKVQELQNRNDHLEKWATKTGDLVVDAGKAINKMDSYLKKIAPIISEITKQNPSLITQAEQILVEQEMQELLKDIAPNSHDDILHANQAHPQEPNTSPPSRIATTEHQIVNTSEIWPTLE